MSSLKMIRDEHIKEITARIIRYKRCSVSDEISEKQIVKLTNTVRGRSWRVSQRLNKRHKEIYS